jgi:SAM-dependent methyltransferase
MMTERFGYGKSSLVVEVASNDGYLLQYFKEKNISVLGVEPTANTAAVAIEKGIPSVVDFFGVRLAKKLVDEGKKADLLLGNNVLAHVPDINDFVGGMKVILKENGVVTMEFPHLYQLVLNNQFDTIYHEHFSYLSFTTVQKIFEKQGLQMFDVEEIPTHGGSLRIFAKHKEDSSKPVTENVAKLLEKEKNAGMLDVRYYSNFQEKVDKIKNDLLEFLLEQKRKGKKVAAYGAAAKGNTLLNYCGVKKDLISFVVDANPAKQNKFMPASHIPITTEPKIKDEKPDFILILPWNIKDEIVKQLVYIKEWGGKFVVPIPKLEILN